MNAEHAIGLSDGLDLAIVQVRRHGSRRAMRDDHRSLRNRHHIGKCLSGNVSDIHDQTKPGALGYHVPAERSQLAVFHELVWDGPSELQFAEAEPMERLEQTEF